MLDNNIANGNQPIYNNVRAYLYILYSLNRLMAQFYFEFNSLIIREFENDWAVGREFANFGNCEKSPLFYVRNALDRLICSFKLLKRIGLKVEKSVFS